MAWELLNMFYPSLLNMSHTYHVYWIDTVIPVIDINLSKL